MSKPTMVKGALAPSFSKVVGTHKISQGGRVEKHTMIGSMIGQLLIDGQSQVGESRKRSFLVVSISTLKFILLFEEYAPSALPSLHT